MKKLLKPFTNIFDVLDVTYFMFNVLGAASFSRAKRSDGRTVYFVDQWDYLVGVVICLISSSGFIMIFFYSPYVVETSTQDRIIYTTLVFVVFMMGVLTTLFGGRRAHFLLASFHLIDEVDHYMKNRRLPLNYDYGRYAAFLYLLIPIYSVLIFTDYYFDDSSREEDNIYEIFHLILCFNLPYLTIAAQAYYVMVIVLTITDRIQQLGYYIDSLKIMKNSKFIEQELVVIAKLHFQLCKSWKFCMHSYGLSHVCFRVLTYIYSLLPLAAMGYIIPDLNDVSVPPALLIMIVTVVAVGKYDTFRDTGLKTVSTVVMFFVQLQNV